MNMELKINKTQITTLDRKLVDILLSVGISANLHGYNYLKESIKLAIDEPNSINAITKVLYPTIARKFNTTSCRVERAIRHALEVSFNKGRMMVLNEIFGLKIFGENDKPTNSEFVALLADRLSIEIKK